MEHVKTGELTIIHSADTNIAKGCFEVDIPQPLGSPPSMLQTQSYMLD